MITENEALSSFHEVYHRSWFKEAPACIVVCADHLYTTSEAPVKTRKDLSELVHWGKFNAD